jgi:hypothetical protein
MPQPLQLRSDEGKKIIHGTEALEQRPVLATAIAVVCVHWNGLEQTLARMFIAALYQVPLLRTHGPSRGGRWT